MEHECKEKDDFNHKSYSINVDIETQKEGHWFLAAHVCNQIIYNIVIHINYCPFCGVKLESKDEQKQT